MSFGPSQQEKSSMSAQTDVANQAKNNSAMEIGQGSGLLNLGGQNVSSGTNFFNTLLHGNQANTGAMLQPDIDRIRQAQQQQLQATSTLMPRGGGRAGALFGNPYAANTAIQTMFNTARSGAAGQLANIGLQQQGLGTNLFGIGNAPLNTSLQGNQNVYQDAFQNRQASNAGWMGLGQGILGLATLPMGGGGGSLFSTLTKGLGGLGKGGGGGGGDFSADYGGNYWGGG